MIDSISHSVTTRCVFEGKYRLSAERAAIVRTAPPLVMDLKEASACLDCSPRKLRDLVAARRIKHARIGAKIVVRRDWLDGFLGA
jgi:excisionase family DNA binding protein